MNRIPRILSFTLIAVLFGLACTKKYTKPADVPPTTYNGGGPSGFPTQSLNQLFKELRSTPEKQCVTAGIQQTVTFSQGTRLTFFPSSFRDASGGIISSGTVCIEMIEMYKPGDKISNWASSTTTDGKILKSGGQVFINATKDGKKVFAASYGIAFPQSSASSDTMKLYYGNNTNEDSVVKWEVFNGGPGTEAAGTWNDSGIISPKYVFNYCTNFAFINCDMLYNTSVPRTQVTVNLHDTSFHKKAILFVVLHNLNAVVLGMPVGNTSPLYVVGDDKNPLLKVPINLVASIVVLAKKDDQFYYFEKNGLTIVDGITVDATMTKQPLDYIKAKLSGL